MTDGVRNLVAMLSRADAIDRAEGLQAYGRYNVLMSRLADLYGQPVDRVTAAFVALSPNSDYAGNLRSLVSVLAGIRDGKPPGDITVSTYKHCRDRACEYVTGAVSFLDRAKGLKVRSFYMNITRPHDPDYVTIDGHMVAAWRGTNGTMKEMIVRPRQYREIKADVDMVARACGLLPNQVQATIWFARKRTMRVKYDPQLGLFNAGDQWRTLVDPAEIKPYG